MILWKSTFTFRSYVCIILRALPGFIVPFSCTAFILLCPHRCSQVPLASLKKTSLNKRTHLPPPCHPERFFCQTGFVHVSFPYSHSFCIQSISQASRNYSISSISWAISLHIFFRRCFRISLLSFPYILMEFSLNWKILETSITILNLVIYDIGISPHLIHSSIISFNNVFVVFFHKGLAHFC